LDQEIRTLYKDAKYCLWTEWDSKYLATIPNAIMVNSKSNDKVDYVYHPVSGERLTDDSLSIIQKLSKSFKNKKPQIQIVISDGLNARSLMDDGHLDAFLPSLFKSISAYPISVSQQPIVIRNGRVRAGYQIGEELFKDNTHEKHCILHIIGERPGTIHRNFSVYITVADTKDWKTPGKIDHNITRVISGISDTAYHPADASLEVANLISEMMK
jgi:ethanolamine ammonia-lyase large subunit